MNSRQSLLNLALVRKLLLAIMLLCGLVWTNYAWFRVPFWPPNKGLMVSEKFVGKLSQKIDSSIPIMAGPGYDSQFFWAMAQDPFAQKNAVAQALDAPAYRYQRAFFAWLCWLTPGSIEMLSQRMLLLNVLGFFLCACVLLRLGKIAGVAWQVTSLSLLVCGGLVFSILHPLADVWATFFSLLGIYMAEKKSFARAALAFMFATLTREGAALVPLSYFLYYSWSLRTVFSRTHVWLALSQLPSIAWQIFLFHRFGAWGALSGSGNFHLPVLNLFHTYKRALDPSLGTGTISAATTATLLFLLACCIIFIIRKKVGSLEAVLVSQCLLIIFAGPAILEQNASLSRLAILFSLLMPVILARSRVFEDEGTSNLGHKQL